jgi:hypothetical protein
MDFWNPNRQRGNECLSRLHTLDQPLLPKCYDTFKGTKIYNIIEHPEPEGDRVYMCVPYACSGAAKERGARWDPEAKRWWHWSKSTQQLAHDDVLERWLEVLEDVHAQSVFAQWPMDTVFMRRMKAEWLDLDDSFDYSKPRV